MRPKHSGSFLLLFLLLFTPTLYAGTRPKPLALKAVSENSTESAPAIAELRALGPAGLKALFEAHAQEISEQIANPLLTPAPQWQRLSAALDAVSQQKDSYLSGLYWYTDVDQAKAAARAAGKPILSLRLLGKLNEEYSCANSRFFRTVLYSNAEMSHLLRERFILHWQSVRPVPRVTIDFGDGRKLERTLTGNSIHYILDTEGRPIDALPGLYGFWPFFRGLERAEQVFKELQGKEAVRRIVLDNYHRGRIAAITSAWVADTGKFGGKIPEALLTRTGQGSPSAREAAPTAITKMSMGEVDLLAGITREADELGKITDEAAWRKIAALHAKDAGLDLRSQTLVRRHTANLFITLGAPATDAQFAKLIANFQRLIALDSVRNEYVLHSKIHAWLLADRNRDDVNGLNEKVYAALFLTPGYDPWLGLLSPEVYTALEGGGVTGREFDIR